MAETHKYFCVRCSRYIFGDTPAQVALAVNAHNDKLHLTECTSWTSINILRSQQYSGSSDAPPYLAQYTHSKEWGDAKPPDITERDKILLSKGGVKW